MTIIKINQRTSREYVVSISCLSQCLLWEPFSGFCFNLSFSPLIALSLSLCLFFSPSVSLSPSLPYLSISLSICFSLSIYLSIYLVLSLSMFVLLHTSTLPIYVSFYDGVAIYLPISFCFFCSGFILLLNIKEQRWEKSRNSFSFPGIWIN